VVAGYTRRNNIGYVVSFFIVLLFAYTSSVWDDKVSTGVVHGAPVVTMTR